MFTFEATVTGPRGLRTFRFDSRWDARDNVIKEIRERGLIEPDEHFVMVPGHPRNTAVEAIERIS